MKKLPFLLSLVLILSLVLSACSSAGDEDTDELSTPGAQVTETTGGDEGTGGLGGLATATTMAPEVTEEPTEAAAGTSTPMAGAAETATPQAGAVETGTPAAGATVTDTTGLDESTDLSRLSVLLGMNIQGADGEDIAEVNNVVLDLCNAQATYVVAGFGGFLEIGEEEVAIPWDAFQLSNTDTDGDGEVDNAISLNITEEQLKNVPGFDAGDVDFTAPNWDADFRTFWETQIEGTGTTTDTTGTTGTEVQATEAVTATESMTGTTGTETAVAAVDRCIVLGEDLLDMDVMSTTELEASTTGAVPAADVTGTPGVEATAPAGATPAATETQAEGTDATGTPAAAPAAGAENELTLGGVEEVILDPSTGDIRYVAIDVDGLGDNSRWVLVPPQALRLVDVDPNDDDNNADALVLNVDAEVLRDAPSFDPDRLPATSVEGWDADLVTFWSGVDLNIDVTP